MDPFQRQLSLFIELCIIVERKCSQFKNNFENGSHNKLLDHSSGKCFGSIYYNDNYKTWTISVDRIEYKNYKQSIELNLSKMNSFNVSEAVEILRNYYDNFDDNFKGKKRTLKTKL
ncbi:hypothetical protein [Clostridium sp.]|jgi:hypothetical protein|uniref:hypothetical protein n=1 Tax=Clostridium sp. TaxID=1506 RepID=UPI003EEE9D81